MPEFAIEAIKIKSVELNKNPIQHLLDVRELIKKLSSHIEGILLLSPQELTDSIHKLTTYTILVPISIPLHTGMIFTRAVKYKNDGVNSCYEKVSRLSYVPTDNSVKKDVGRLNLEGQSIYYASLNNGINSISAVLSEMRAIDGEIFNILISRTGFNSEVGNSNEALNVVPLGIFDYFRRGVPTPFLLSDLHRKIHDLWMANLHPTARIATQLCDAFITRVLKENERLNLYDVTSTIGSVCMLPDAVDGIIYPSTRFDGHPNFALKTSSVDSKFRHEETLSVKVIESFDFGLYQIANLNHGLIEGENIRWMNS